MEKNPDQKISQKFGWNWNLFKVFSSKKFSGKVEFSFFCEFVRSTFLFSGISTVEIIEFNDFLITVFIYLDLPTEVVDDTLHAFRDIGTLFTTIGTRVGDTAGDAVSNTAKTSLGFFKKISDRLAKAASSLRGAAGGKYGANDIPPARSS